ncbi:restriction endonuclease subunit S [Limosilactobacillus reuteri]|uniref:restriction endonuclease subunit S n=1 Tax=Limosilactobacillus reuteri TaxID=1598 RepID=UPI00006B80D3|nr:restriction endonuclease subunit S [Limosilactobacillus reuteri]MCC4461005.1 restriction endonuclease subunit S [Limosilactobacillus reuteri]MCC4462540.1 restriction endonuclease subunit S [Limosilactobacillus reuteri]MCC4469249.1 restriction endonuclease subunit S [Limosilactobacillus reuteri]MCT3210755.1 restriction endonuclease subunit S [Limosilactobacillus reuteri]PTS29457.1 restriction endonuclease [Limosilactobacillus reuteri]
MEYKKFTALFTDVTKTGTKIPKDEYLTTGKNIIIDQGKDSIAGYTDRQKGIFEEVPVIVFGDHTRIVKYIDKPFFLGADGVKVLKSKEKESNYKYLYYALKAAHIPNTGYNRHFKWLKQINMNYPDLNEQKNIVDILDSLTRIIKVRQKELAFFDKLIKARFVEMFGDPISNKKSWKKRLLNDLVDKIGSGATPKGGKESYQDHGISFIRSMNVHDGYFNYKDLAYINSTQAKQLSNVIVQSQDVFINITGASVARSCIVPDDILPARVNQHVSIIRCKSDVLNPIFINNLFLNDSFKRILLSIGLSGGATRQAITKKQLEMLKIILPPISLQNEYANFVHQVDKSKVVIQKSLDETQKLYDSLMQEYFG